MEKKNKKKTLASCDRLLASQISERRSRVRRIRREKKCVLTEQSRKYYDFATIRRRVPSAVRYRGDRVLYSDNINIDSDVVPVTHSKRPYGVG